VRVAFDMDAHTNPAVAQALGQLVVSLSGLSVQVSIEQWDPQFKGIDDALHAGAEITALSHEDSIRFASELAGIEQPAIDDRPFVSLESLRDAGIQSRLESIGKPGLYFDGRPTGCGKSHADAMAYREAAAGRAVELLPTHEGLQTRVAELQAMGLNAAAYPRVDESNCGNWEQAQMAQNVGLPHTQTACKTCPTATHAHCMQAGWKAQMGRAAGADVQLMTHDRAAALGLDTVSPSGGYVAVHEQLYAVMRPQFSASRRNINKLDGCLCDLIEDLDNDPEWLNQPADSIKFARELADVVARCLRGMARIDGAECEQLPSREPMPIPERLLPELMRYVRGIGGSVLRPIVEHMTQSADLVLFANRLVATKLNRPNPNCTTWVCDATATPDEVRQLVGMDVLDKTPIGRLKPVHQVQQILCDVTVGRTNADGRNSGTSTKTVLSLVRGFLTDHTDIDRLGIICHKRFKKAIDQLPDEWRNRIEMLDHWRSGSECGSNDWFQRCDGMLILGTPRIPPPAYQNQLIRMGRPGAAATVPEWKQTQWMSDGGRLVTVGGYADPEWKQTHRILVEAKLRQAIGRGRGALADGIPVWCCTNENLELPTAPDIQPVKCRHQKVLNALRMLGECSSSSIASHIGYAHSRNAQMRLAELEQRGLVERIGGGQTTRWRLIDQISLQPDADPDPDAKSISLAFGSGSDCESVRITGHQRPDWGNPTDSGHVVAIPQNSTPQIPPEWTGTGPPGD